MSSLDPRRTRRAGGAKRTLVLDQVVAVLADRGYAGTRFSDVSEASGVAVSTLQGYFGSREDMLIEALRRVTSVAVADMNEFAARFDDDPWQQLVAMVDRGLSTDLVTWRVLMEFWTAAAHDAELREHAAVLAEQYREPFADAVRRGIESGAFTPRFDTAAVVEVVVADIVGLLYPVVLGHLTPQDTDYRDVVLAQLAFALMHEDPATTRPPTEAQEAPITRER
jgi:AcrR family transcriptional regulator